MIESLLGALLTESMLQSLLGVLLGAWIVIQVEKLRKPKLKLRLLPTYAAVYPEKRPAKQSRVIKIEAINEMLPRWASWMTRSAALHCRGAITFHHMDGQNIFGRSMPIKWVRTTEALPMEIRAADGVTVSGYLIDPERIMAESQEDIAPGEAAELDVVVRYDDEEECYGWNMESYRYAWRNPSWKLGPGRYLLRVEVFSGDQRCSAVFRLINDVPPDAFRLEPAMAVDKI
jgi:hypothetical protein